MKYAALFSAITFSALVFTGCTSKPPAELNFYSDDQSEQISMDSLDSTTEESSSDMTNAKGLPMKKLEDFKKIEATTATLVTTKGEITFELYPDKTPITVQNFLNLAESGFYDGIVFHRVIADFMAQVGDPLTKDASKQALWGTGDPGYVIPDEFDDTLTHDSAGVVSMANAGPNSGGSQFFITYEATPWLDGKHAVFGKVTKGLDVLDKIEIGDKIESVRLE